MKRNWIIVALAVGMSLAGYGQAATPARFTISADQIARALSGKGLSVAETQVSLLAQVVATEANPELDVVSVETLQDRPAGEGAEARSRVKLVCHSSGMCLPFYAIVSLPHAAVAGAGAVSVKGFAAEPAGASVTGNALLGVERPVTMPAGTHAILVMDDTRAHIQVSVVTLEKGAPGHKIRVASPDHKQFYVAEVVSANLLKRSF